MSDNNKLINTEFLGKYKILKEIGRGGMDSVVYLAEIINFDQNDYFSNKFKYVAIKFIKKTKETTNEHWNRILDEGVTNARLADSDYIVKLYEIHPLDKETIVLVMEYIDGPTLKTLIRDKSCLAITEALSIFKKILLGVNDMHSKDHLIIHRDLKPENIMLSKDMLDVKIADFGISSVLVRDEDNIKNVLTDENTFFGTIPYVTPDATKLYSVGDKKLPMITKQYDFHALGIIFYEMLVGEKPFDIEDENDQNIILYWKNYDVMPMSKIDKNFRNEIENIFLKLTASRKNIIDYRYNDVEEIIEDINELEKKIADKSDQTPSILPYENRVFQKSIYLDLEKKSNDIHTVVQRNKITITVFCLFFFVFILFIIFLCIGL